MLRRSLRTTRTPRSGDTPADGSAIVPGEALAAGTDEGSPLITEDATPGPRSVVTTAPSGLPDLTTSLPVIDPDTVTFITDAIDDGVGAGPDPADLVAMSDPGRTSVGDTLAVVLDDGASAGVGAGVGGSGGIGGGAVAGARDGASDDAGAGVPVAVDAGLPLADGGPGELDLLRDAFLIEGPATAPITRRAQHHRRRRLSASGQPRIGLAAVTLSAATVAVLAAGTVQGLRADDQRALLGQSTLVGRDGVTTALSGGGDEEAISPRRSTSVVAQEAQQELRAQAAARTRAEAEAAAQRAAQQAAAQAAERAAAQQRAAAAAQARQQAAQQQASRSATRTAPVAGGSAQSIAQALLAQRGWSGQWTCLNQLWDRESGWNYQARNPSSGAFGIPQALPGSKMASAGADWATNPATQIRWGLSYIASTYGTPCGAWAHSQATGWY